MGMQRIFTQTSQFLRSLAYDAAGFGNRSQGWADSNPGPNAALIGSSDTLRRRSRSALRNSTWASAGVEAIVSNVVGSGIHPMHADDGILKLWKKFCKKADADENTNFAGLQALVMRSAIEGGDCFIRMRPRYLTDGLPVPMQLQVLEAEMVPSGLNKQLENGNRIVGGIEFNKRGKRVAYHFLKEHPGENLILSTMSFETVRVKADRVLHVRLTKRPGEVRGEPWLARALVRIKELDSYDDAELVRKKTAALFGGFIQTPGVDPSLDKDVALSIQGTPSQTGEMDENGNYIEDEEVYIEPLEPGSFPVLPAGYDVKMSQPADVGGNYVAFMQMQLRSIAASLGITYEQLTGDLSGVNDRTIRASLLEFKRRARMWQQQMIVHQFCEPVWEEFLRMAELAGKVDLSDESLDDDPQWVAESWEYINPQQEVRALAEEVRNGFKSRSEVISQRSKDPVKVDQQIAADNERADELGLMHASDGRYAKSPSLSSAIGEDEED